jgi:hypothetical protein
VYKGKSLADATLALTVAITAMGAVTSDLIVHYSDVRLVEADTAFHANSHLDESQHESIGAVDIFSDKDSFRAVTEDDKCTGTLFTAEQFQSFVDELTRKSDYKDAQALLQVGKQDAVITGTVPTA